MVKRIKINVHKGKHAQFWRDQWKDEVALSSHFLKLYPLLGKQLAFNNQSRIPSSCWDLIIRRNPNDSNDFSMGTSRDFWDMGQGQIDLFLNKHSVWWSHKGSSFIPSLDSFTCNCLRTPLKGKGFHLGAYSRWCQHQRKNPSLNPNTALLQIGN